MRGAVAVGAYGSAVRIRVNQLLSTLDADAHAAGWVLALTWGATRLILFIGLLAGHSYCDPAFYKYAGLLAAGQWPYRNVAVEYPPLAMLLLLLPALPLLAFPSIAPRPDAAFNEPLARLPQPDPVRYGAYGISFAVEMLVIDVLTLWLVRRAARRHLAGDPQGVRSGLLYIMLVFASGALLQKFDLVVGTLCLVAVVALAERRTWLAWGAVAVAALVKGYPLLVLPVLIVYELRQARARIVLVALRERKRELSRGVIVLGVTLAIPTLLVTLLAGFSAVVDTITYHTGRGTEIESLYANVILAVGWLPGLAVTTSFHPADLSRVVHSRLEGAVDPASLVFLALLLVVAYAAVWRGIWRGRSARVTTRQGDIQLLAIGVTCVLLAFVLSFRALPAHYLLVVLPLAAIVRLPSPSSQRLWVGGLVGVMALGQIVEIVWHALVGLAPWAVLILSLRNIAWVVAFALLVVTLWQWPVELAQARSWEKAGHEGRRKPRQTARGTRHRTP